MGPMPLRGLALCHTLGDVGAALRVEYKVRRALGVGHSARYRRRAEDLMRSFPRSQTKMRPSAAAAMPCGRMNWPGPAGHAPRALELAARENWCTRQLP